MPSPSPLGEATAELLRARGILERTPEDCRAFGASLMSAIGQIQKLKSCEAGEAKAFLAECERVTALFHHAEAFYQGWGALAVVPEREPAKPTVSVQA